MHTLRPYQKDALTAIFDAEKSGKSRILYALPTGCGKTTVFAALVQEYVGRGKRVLVLAHRRELIYQAYERILAQTGLSEWEVGIEQASDASTSAARVVVGSVMTVKGSHRLPGWKPDIIIIDEAHRAAANTYRSICTRYGVHEGECLLIGCTATPRRNDRKSLFAELQDGTRLTIEMPNGTKRPAKDDECIFQKLVYDFPFSDAIEQGWLSPIVGYNVRTDTDLTRVSTRAGDFAEGELEKAVTNAERTLQAISAWSKHASDRQTLVFCAGVQHARHTAQLWKDAGYSCMAIDGETDDESRMNALKEFRVGNLQILVNCGIYTEGTDLPNCSCIVHLRPTKSWNLYVQMTGRGTRPLPGVIDGFETAQERKNAIAASPKPDCVVIDVVDITKDKSLCGAPGLIGLPVGFTLNGQDIVQAKSKMDAYKQKSAFTETECPVDYEAIEVILNRINLLEQYDNSEEPDWIATEDGYRYRRVRPGYSVKLIEQEQNRFRLTVTGPQGMVLLDKMSQPNSDLYRCLDSGARIAKNCISDYAQSERVRTSDKLSPKQLRCLLHYHTREEIDKMPLRKARNLIGHYSTEWRARIAMAKFSRGA